MGEIIDDIGGLKEIANFDDEGNLVSLQRQQDVEGILEECKAAFNQGLVNPKSEFRRVASIPTNVVQMYAAKRGVTFEDVLRDKGLLMEMVNDPDLSSFRTLAGRY